MAHIVFFLLIGAACSLLPIPGIEAVCPAQVQPPQQAGGGAAVLSGPVQAQMPDQPAPQADPSTGAPGAMALPPKPVPRFPVPSPRPPESAIHQPSLIAPPGVPSRSVQAAGSPGAMAVSPRPAAENPAPALRPGDSPGPRKGQFTLNFDDADMYSIIHTVFGEILRASYVVDPRVKGRVTFRAIAPVPADKVLPLMEVILRLNGVAVVEESGLYRILPISDISKEPSPISIGRDPAAIPTTGKALVQVVPITYIASSEALKLITPFASTNAVLIDAPKSNQIIIVDTDANVRRLLKLVEVFDNESLQKKKPQVYVYPVQNGAAKDIASLLQQIFLGGRGATPDRGAAASRTGTGGQVASPAAAGPAAPSPSQAGAAASGEALVSGTTKIIADEITNNIIIMASPEDYAAIKETIQQIDIVPRQVVIEGMIASVQLIDNLSLGLGALFKGSIGNLNTNFGLNTDSLSKVDPTKLATSGFTFVGTDVAGAVRGLITALATNSKAKLLATPHILVSDNREAKIQVGQQVPLVTSETIATPGVSAQRNIQYRDIGIILKAKPRVNAGGLVSLELYQEVSTFTTIPLFADEKQIILNKTDATTSLVVQDNQTIVIGGLIREDTSKGRTGIPWLTKIPVLGWLFGNTSDESTREELIILLTPHVIRNQAEARGVSDGYIDQMSESSKGGMKREEIMRERPLKQKEESE